MESLSERALLFADDARLNYLEEARAELTGQSRRKWALLLAALVIGAAVALIVMAISVRRAVETDSGTDADTAAAAPALASTSGTRRWERWAGNARAGLSTVWRSPARS